MPKWTERYNVHKLDLLDGRFPVVVDWSARGYEVSCCGIRLKKRWRDLDRAKEAGAALADGLAKRILAELKEMPVPSA